MYAIKAAVLKSLKIVHGGWSSWTDWSTCSVTCGNGTQWKTRTCTNPEPAENGIHCSGNSLETGLCFAAVCRSVIALILFLVFQFEIILIFLSFII